MKKPKDCPVKPLWDGDLKGGVPVSDDVTLKKGKVLFGIKQGPKGIEAVVLPMFDVSRCRLGNLEKVLTRINQTPRGNLHSVSEMLLLKSIGNMNTRFIWADGTNIVPLDQEAATQLFQMGVPIKKKGRHYISM